jgi:hypothetical protein
MNILAYEENVNLKRQLSFCNYHLHLPSRFVATKLARTNIVSHSWTVTS